MSTRSNIALESLDGTVRAIYCHHDGYPEGVGALLATYYRTDEAIEDLLALGDLSTLDQTPTESRAYSTAANKYPATIYKSRADYAESAEHSDVEYLYLNVCGCWLVYDVDKTKTWRRLDQVITVEEPEDDGVVVTAEQVKRAREQEACSLSLRYTLCELKRRADVMDAAIREFEPARRVRDLAPNVDKELDDKGAKLDYMRALLRGVKDLVDKGLAEAESKAI